MATIDDFVSSPKIVAIYQPGPNWPRFRELLSEHIDFVKVRLDDGTMAFGAPMADREGRPVGGLFIYHDADLDMIEALVKQDVFVTSRVVTSSLACWGMARGKRDVMSTP
jgi:uncharacterized protein YciI